MPRKLPNSSALTPTEKTLEKTDEKQPEGERERLQHPDDGRLLTARAAPVVGTAASDQQAAAMQKAK